jgi:anti-anti-sigma factor
MTFTATQRRDGGTAVITLTGELDAQTAPEFQAQVTAITEDELDQLVLDMTDLTYLSSAGLRSLVFCRQKLADNVRMVVVRPHESVEQTIRMVGFHHSVAFSDQVPEPAGN